ncbi:MAG TPA: SpoIIE family protein phosphatase [Solirubrobacterales bacterium]|nr:SpoIIE family protein phosphatase [Solirubrobacterales bacterium]
MEAEGQRTPPGVSSGRRDQLLGITASALAYMSLEDMLGTLLERIRDALEVDTAAVLLLDEDRGVLLARAARGLEEEVRQGIQVPLARGFAGRVAAEARPIIIDLDRAEVVNPILRQKGVRSMLGVPLTVDGRVIGVMHIGTLVRREFDADDVALLQLAADRAARAIEEAQLAEMRAVTAIMQRTLLPEALPDLPGMRFSAKYLPGGTGVRLGGDWYDVFPLRDGRQAFVVGDVVGRGVVAASMMGEVRTALRAYMFAGHPLTEVVAMLNDLLVSIGRNRGATLAIFELDPQREELEAILAGHVPPLLVDPDGASRLLEQTPGLPVGVSGGNAYESVTYPFPLGSALLLYTDGLIERRGESLDVGFGRLTAAAEAAVRETKTNLADDVYRALLDETPLEDDVALLAIETLRREGPLEMTFPTRASVLAEMRATLRRWLAAAGVDADQQFDLTLSASEAAANAIEHAYGGTESTFAVSADKDGDTVTITVRDTGSWRTARTEGGGRGLTIMRRLVDEVRITSDAVGTTVELIERVARRR